MSSDLNQYSSLLQDKGQQVLSAGQVNPDERGFAITSIIAIIEVIVELIKLYKACKQTPSQAVSTIQNPGLLEKAALRRQLRKKVKTSPELNLDVGVLQDGFNKMGRSITADEMNQLYTEIQ